MSFGSDLLEKLAVEFRRRFKAYEFVDCQKDEYIGDFRISFDLYLERLSKIVIVEIELRREVPLHNVAKTLLWASRMTGAKEISMIQAFDRNYYCKNGHSLSVELSSFFGEQARRLTKSQRCFTYRRLFLDIPQNLYTSKSQHNPGVVYLATRICDQIGSLGVL